MKPMPWQQLVLNALTELSDASFQERAWLRGEGDEISSPSETVNQLFDDSGLTDLLDAGAVFSDRADSALRQLSNLVDTIDFEQSIEHLLADDRWSTLRQLSLQAIGEVKVALNEG